MLTFQPKKLWPFGESLVYEGESQYHYIRVTQKAGVRTLYFRKGPGAARQSSINLKNHLHLELEYTRMVFAGLMFIEEPKRVLVLGLGGGLIPTVLRHHFPTLQLDVVEIDPKIVWVAEKYFFYSKRRPTRTIVLDGRVFVRRAASAGWRYDMVVLDAYTGSYIPPHLMAKEFLEQVGSILAPGGCVVSNIHTTNRLYDYEQRTYAAAFSQNHTFLGKTSTNAVLVSKNGPNSMSKADLKAKAQALQDAHKFEFDLTKIVQMYSDEKKWETEGDILTDDFSPVNLLRMRGR